MRVGEIFTALTLRRCQSVSGPVQLLAQHGLALARVHMLSASLHIDCACALAGAVHFLEALSRTRDISTWASVFNDQLKLASPWTREASVKRYDADVIVIRVVYAGCCWRRAVQAVRERLAQVRSSSLRPTRTTLLRSSQKTIDCAQ